MYTPMGNSNPTVNPQLKVVYKGPVVGRLPDNTDGIILSNNDPNNNNNPSALDPRIVEALLNSIGPVEELQLVSETDLTGFTLDLPSPHSLEYKPFFFDRKNEYGWDHKYYEALCHALPNRETIPYASARYYTGSSAILTSHPPASIHFCAFIESVRTINQLFLEELHKTLLNLVSKDLPADIISEFIDGAFRNIAIQLHFNAPTHPRDLLFHIDHVFSALHLSVTLNGRRTIGFATPNNKEVSMGLKAGDVYITTPSAISHGISTENLTTSERSVAVQCRTLLGAHAAFVLSVNNSILCAAVGGVLERFPLRMPTYEEWEMKFKELVNSLLLPGKPKMEKLHYQVSRGESPLHLLY